MTNIPKFMTFIGSKHCKFFLRNITFDLKRILLHSLVFLNYKYFNIFFTIETFMIGY